MKCFTFVCALSLLSVASIAHADINGSWSGVWNDSDSYGDTDSYPGFQLAVATANGQINISEPNGFTYLDGMVLNVSGCTVSLNGNAVGTTDGSSINLVLLDQIDGLFDQITITQNEDGTLSYSDHFADYYGDYINGTSIMTSCGSQGTNQHAPLASKLKALFAALPKKAHH